MSSAQHSAPVGRGRYIALDSLRGVAAILVCLYHFKVNSHLSGLGLIRNGWMFVDFFFVLSGFVICLGHARSLGSREEGAVGAFLIRRFGRIFPLHLAVLLAFLAFELASLAVPQLAGGGAFEEGKTLKDFTLTLFLLNCFGLAENLKWNTPSWSIAAEWWTYVAFAVAAALSGRRLGLVMGGMATAALIVMMASLPSIYAVYDFGFWRCLLGFGVGALLATFWEGLEPRLRRLPTIFWHAAETLLLAAVVWMVADLAHGRWSFLSPLLFALCVAAVAVARGWVSRLLMLPPLLFTGEISYGIYMVQALVIARFNDVLRLGERALGLDLMAPASFAAPGSGRLVAGATAWQGDLFTLLLLGTVMLAALLGNRFVERPGQEWARREAARRRPSRARALAP